MCLRTNKPLWILSLLAASVAAVTTNAMADLVTSGDVSPGGPGGDWSIGSNLDGTVTLSGGSAMASRDMYVAIDYDRIGIHGTMNVTTGATWSNDYILLGQYGSGVLNISSGGRVTTGQSIMGSDYFSGGNGTANVTGSGSTWTLSSNLSIGGYGIGRLNITNGGVVSNGNGDLSNGPYANGKAIVDGAHSQWNNSGFLNVGKDGTGKLSISNGGTVTSNGAAINYSQNDNACSAAVTGAHSTWSNTGNLKLSYYGPAALTIAGGGAVTSTSLDAGMGSKIAITVGDASLLDLRGGDMKDIGGTVRLSAGAKVAVGTYKPIEANSWDDATCKYVSVGGKWDRTQHTFTVSSAANGSTGNAVTIDPFSTQKIVITAADGKSVGASFQPGETSSELVFTANSLSGSESNALKITSGQEVLAGWTFSATGAYTQGNPVYLSLQIGSGYSSGDLKIWHLDTNGWSDYSDKFADLSYDGNDVSFTATGFSGYAVTGASVPEPTAMLILLPTAVLAMRRRR